MRAFFHVPLSDSAKGRRALSGRIVALLGSYSTEQDDLNGKIGRTPACVKTCNIQDTMSAAWRKERSTVETNEVMKNAAHRSESWCWRQLHAADTCSKTRHVPFLCVRTQTSVLSTVHHYIKISSSLDDVMSSTREDVIRRRHVLLQCADSSLNHEWSKTASFVSCLDACLDAVGVRPPLNSLASSVFISRNLATDS
jgi:hypothetical protein